MWLLDAETGFSGGCVAVEGLPQKTAWAIPRVAPYSLASVSIWKIAGYSMVIFLAGLQTSHRFSRGLALDGAGRVLRFRCVTWPRSARPRLSSPPRA